MKRKHAVDALFPLVLYGMFAVFSLLLVLIGARVYKGIVSDSENQGSVRSSVSYVANKVRAAPEGVRLESRNGADILVIPESGMDADYETLIYFSDGCLRELFKEADGSFSPDSGEEITALSSFSISRDGESLLITSEGINGDIHSMHLSLRTS